MSEVLRETESDLCMGSGGREHDETAIAIDDDARKASYNRERDGLSLQEYR